MLYVKSRKYSHEKLIVDIEKWEHVIHMLPYQPGSLHSRSS